MPLNPQEQERANRLNQQFPRGGIPVDIEADLRNNLIDRQADEIMNTARNRAAFYNDRLMVPSDAELQYRSTSANPLAEGLAKQPRPNPTPPTTPPNTATPVSRTSSATPPPTPRTSGLGASNGMQSLPSTATPRSSLTSANSRPGAIPGGLPGPAGSLILPGVGAALNFGQRLIVGQPIGKAAFGAAGTFGGTVVGGTLGSAFGPVGTFVGGMVGGFLGGLAADLIYNAAFPPTAEPGRYSPQQKSGPLPFMGGQSDAVSYTVSGIFHAKTSGNNLDYPSQINSVLFGPIGGSFIEEFPPPDYYKLGFISRGNTSAGLQPYPYRNYPFSSNKSQNGTLPYIEILGITRSDGQPDIGGNISPLPVPIDNRLPESIAHPGNVSYAPSSAQVPPLVSPNGGVGASARTPALNNYAPGGTASKSNGTSTTPLIPVGVPANSPHPSNNPLPIAGLPEVASASSPSSKGAPTNTGAGIPGKSPFTFYPDGSYEIVSPGHPLTTGNPQNNLNDVSYPPAGFQPKILPPNQLTANPLTSTNFSTSPDPNTATPSGMPQTTSPKVSPDATKETPTVPVPTPTPDLATEFQKEIEKLKKQQEDQLIPVLTLLAGVTALLNPIANNTTPSAITAATGSAVCNSFAPGGCAAPVAQNAQNAANNSASNNALLAQILAFLQALQTAFMVPLLAGVNLINNKLGPVMAGVNGIGGFLARTAEAAKIDKVLNAMNTILLLHNAAMLSRNLVSTLGDLTSQALATIGIKDSESSPIDVNEILGKQANNFMASLLDAEVWAGTKTSWNKASSIISSATNIMYTVRSMFDSTREILEWTAENTGKIGNALKRFRVVGENAYKWLPKRVTVQNRFTQRLDRIRVGTDSLDDAASSLSGVLGEVQSIQSEYADLQEQKQKFDKNISELTPKTREENKPISDAVTAAKTASKAPTEIENVFRGEGAPTDA